MTAADDVTGGEDPKEHMPSQEPSEAQLAAAMAGWELLTGHPLTRSPKDTWKLASWFRRVRQQVVANLDEQLQPATVFMPAGAAPLPASPRAIHVGECGGCSPS
jgi:hypothetical protein